MAMMWAGTLTVGWVEIHQVRLVSASWNSSIKDHSIQSPPLGFNELCSLRYEGSATTPLLHPMQLKIYQESHNGSASFFGVCLFRFEFCGIYFLPKADSLEDERDLVVQVQPS